METDSNIWQRELTLYAFVLQYCEMLAAGIDDHRLAEQPLPGVNHPAWILGHLAVGTDYAAKILGERFACPIDWHRQFGPGSTISGNRSIYPTKDELLAAIRVGHARVTAALAHVDEAKLAAPNPLGVLVNELPTVGDMLAHLLTTHAATHLGQLSAWRRMIGLPEVIEVPKRG